MDFTKDIYRGYWFEDLRSGFGIFDFKNGDWYKGIFSADMRHGIGVFYEKKGSKYYIGNWEENNIKGTGIIYNSNFYYEGDINNGIMQGYGYIFYYANKFFYKGEFKDNLLEGYGDYFVDNKNYSGYFHKGKGNKNSILDQFENIEIIWKQRKKRLF